MNEGLLALIVEKGYEAVRAQDILDRANLGRSTFFSRYRDKDELLLNGFDNLRVMQQKRHQDLLAAKEGAEFNLVLELGCAPSLSWCFRFFRLLSVLHAQ